MNRAYLAKVSSGRAFCPSPLSSWLQGMSEAGGSPEERLCWWRCLIMWQESRFGERESSWIRDSTMSSVDCEMSTLSTAKIPDTHSWTVATDALRDGGMKRRFWKSNLRAQKHQLRKVNACVAFWNRQNRECFSPLHSSLEPIPDEISPWWPGWWTCSWAACLQAWETKELPFQIVCSILPMPLESPGVSVKMIFCQKSIMVHLIWK